MRGGGGYDDSTFSSHYVASEKSPQPDEYSIDYYRIIQEINGKLEQCNIELEQLKRAAKEAEIIKLSAIKTVGERLMEKKEREKKELKYW